MRRAGEAVIYEHPMYECDCPATSAPMWLVPDYLLEPYGRFWADFTWLTRQLHEGKIRILDARMFQDACEWALQRLQAGIDAGLAFLYAKLVGAGATGRQLLVEGILGSLWGAVAWVGRAAWGAVEWVALGVVAAIASLWTLVTTSIHFLLHAVLTIARACVDVVLASLREVGKFGLWLVARTARGVADTIVGAIEAVVGGVVAFGIWVKEGAVAVRMAIYRLILDVLLSIRAFFVDVGLLIWAFIVDTAMAARQASLDTVAALATVVRSSMYVRLACRWLIDVFVFHACGLINPIVYHPPTAPPSRRGSTAPLVSSPSSSCRPRRPWTARCPGSSPSFQSASRSTCGGGSDGSGRRGRRGNCRHKQAGARRRPPRRLAPSQRRASASNAKPGRCGRCIWRKHRLLRRSGCVVDAKIDDLYGYTSK